MFLKGLIKFCCIFSTLYLAGAVGCTTSSITPKVNDVTMKNCIDFVLYKRLQKSLLTATKALSASKYDVANSIFQEGINTLGNKYFNSAVIDDTDMKLNLALFEEQKGNKRVAAYLKKSVLESRLLIYSKKLNCNSKE